MYSKGVATPSLPVLSLSSLLCTLTAQVEAGVGQLNIYTFLAFILQHTYLASMNGVLLTPFNSYSKQVLLAQLTRNGRTARASTGPCCISTFTTFPWKIKRPVLLVGANKLLRRSGRHVTSSGLSLHEQYLKLKVQASSPPLLLHHLLLFFLVLPFSLACSLLCTSGETLGETVAPSCFH